MSSPGCGKRPEPRQFDAFRQMEAGGIRPGPLTLGVVPAKAGTHTPRERFGEG